MNVEYKETFYIVPRRIRELPGMTLGYLDVYETIFQFWNKHLPCYLSNPIISQRTNLKESQIYEALNYFETHGELERRHKGGRRYLVQPPREVETDSTKPILESAPPDGGVRSSGLQGSAGADHNIKKRNKEINLTDEKFLTTQTPTPITPVELIDIFKRVFPGHSLPVRQKTTGALSPLFLKKVIETKKECLAVLDKPLTKELFMDYLDEFKRNAPGFCDLRNKETGRKIGLSSFIGWVSFQKLISGEYF